MRTVAGSVYYAAPRKEPLFWYQHAPPPGMPTTNIEFVEHVVAIRDARQAPEPLRLDVEGAVLHRQRSSVLDFYDEQELRRVGYEEAAAIARDVSGAAHAFVFDHNLRRGTEGMDTRYRAAQKPVFHIHTDFSSAAAPIRARAAAMESAIDALHSALDSGRRFAALNVWRPITGPVRDCPLALCDASSVADGDLLPASLIYPDREGEIYYLKHNGAHRWWYLSDMQSDEVWVFKNFDSAIDGRARFTPHTAFIETPAPVTPRESVEFRAFVVFD